MIVPKNIGLDGHGNLPRGTLRSLQRRPDVFVGKVKSKDGTMVSGSGSGVGRQGSMQVPRAKWHGTGDNPNVAVG
jgi:hypothetical protein